MKIQRIINRFVGRIGYPNAILGVVAKTPIPQAAAIELNLGILSFEANLRYESPPKGILVTEGLISLLSWEEMEMVIAHEIGHLALHHQPGATIVPGSSEHCRREKEADEFAISKLGIKKQALARVCRKIVDHLPLELVEQLPAGALDRELSARFPEEERE